jgi:endoglycosylceramidase
MNVVYKSAPYVPLTGESAETNPRLAFSRDDAELLNKLGQNVIRLGVIWAGVEPIQGQYNMTYI